MAIISKDVLNISVGIAIGGLIVGGISTYYDKKINRNRDLCDQILTSLVAMERLTSDSLRLEIKKLKVKLAG